MTLPSSTYRVQFRDGMTFDHAAEIVPYLQRLGISHLYASPIFTATAGSTHGYDVTNCNEIDPAIGGRAGFDRLSNALKTAGIGLLLDIVPNHMAASLENAWWRSVVEWGEESEFSHYFDIDWSQRLTLPMLGKTLDKTIDAGELKFALDIDSGTIGIAYFDSVIPLSPRTYSMLSMLGDEIDAVVERAAASNEQQFHDALRPILQGRIREIESVLSTLSGDRALLRHILKTQPWELLHWKEAAKRLSYRRFFEVTGLAGVRVEDVGVFEASHRLVFELVRSGVVDGLRLDHIDGLADPTAYLNRLRQAVGNQTYIIVEKILADGEVLPQGWPISGTTGYEFTKAIPDVMVDCAGMAKLTTAYKDISAPEPGFDEGSAAVKSLLARKNFFVETNNLLKLLAEASKLDGEVALNGPIIEVALVSLLVACPVYRTYGTASGLDEGDVALWKSIVAKAAESPEKPDRKALAFIDCVFRGQVKDEVKEVANVFRRRFQQLTGPLTAKSIEDTMFYRYNRLLALNEVGGEPAANDFSVSNFHKALVERAAYEPQALSATSTHDTKRGEDTRARLYALSEAPDVWLDAVSRWQKMNGADVADLPEGAAPEPRVQWLLYQALAGVWPADAGGPLRVPADLKKRFTAYVEKALREAKQRTNWGEENAAYETAVKAFAEKLVSENSDFLVDFTTTVRSRRPVQQPHSNTRQTHCAWYSGYLSRRGAARLQPRRSRQQADAGLCALGTRSR